MHSSAKGKHGSKKPLSKETPEWIELKPKEAIELVLEADKDARKQKLSSPDSTPKFFAIEDVAIPYT